MRADKISQETLNIIDASALSGNELRLPGQLDRKTYVAVAKVIEAAGGKWDRKSGAHVFESEAADAIDQLIATGGVSRRQEMQQFFTPAALADRIIAIAEINRGHLVLEPSVGKGALAYPAQSAGADVHAYELDISLWRGIEVECSCGDFLQFDQRADYDRVVMNPPFARQADIRHVKHAIGFLKPRGRLVSIMSSGTRFRENALTVSFREAVAELGGRFEDLPEGAFKESGTMVNACILTVQT